MEETESNQQKNRPLVNPVAIGNCVVRYEGHVGRVADVSFVRLVVQEETPWPEIPEATEITLDFQLERESLQAQVILKSRRDGWLRFQFQRIVPSARAHLRSFLSPKKIGESIIEDWRSEAIRHFHGLNESELWFDSEGGVLFTYLDQTDFDSQFMIRVSPSKGPLKAGKVLRKDYMGMNSLEAELPMVPLTDREIVAKLGECRDIVTNFRPIGQVEYNLKQKLLRVISDQLYSTSHRVDLSPMRPHRTVATPLEN